MYLMGSALLLSARGEDSKAKAARAQCAGGSAFIKHRSGSDAVFQPSSVDSAESAGSSGSSGSAEGSSQTAYRMVPSGTSAICSAE